jgi:hypothetical protein
MKAIPTLTIYQPTASLFFFYRLKWIETRTPQPCSPWQHQLDNLIGKTIAIHAGKRWVGPPSPHLVRKHEILIGQLDEAVQHGAEHRGVVVGVVHVVEARWLRAGDQRGALCHVRGRYGLFFENPRRFREPIPVKGQQRIWDWEPPEGWEGLLI